MMGMTSRVQRYSRSKDGDTYVAPNFQVEEFACHDGTDEILIDLALVHVLQELRNRFQKIVHVNSGYRTALYNAKIGGAAKSQHVLGKAADIRISGVTPATVAKAAREILGKNYGGVGTYDSFVHVDTRITPTDWKG